MDAIRLLGGSLGMLPRFRIFETRELKMTANEPDESGEPIAKKKKKGGLKNERKFVVDEKLELKSTGF